MEVAKLYNGEVTLNFEPTKHIYEVDGERKVSVTGVTGVVNKPALTWWAAHEAGREIIEVLTGGIFSAKDKKTYRVKEGEIPQTPQLDEVSIEKLYQDARFAHYRKKTTAADIGTLVHNWVERYIKGENPTMPANDKVKNGVDAFLKWEKENDVKFLHSEIKIYSKEHDYAGTMDFEAMVNGKLVIGDLKTSSGIYDEMRLQVAAYRQAREEETGQKYDHQVIIRLGKELVDGEPDIEIAEFDNFEKDIKAFLGALALHSRLSELKEEYKNKK